LDGITNINDALEEIERAELAGARLNIPVENIPFYIEAYAQWCAKWNKEPESRLVGDSEVANGLNRLIQERVRELRAAADEIAIGK
jgi:hypothetical protein